MGSIWYCLILTSYHAFFSNTKVTVLKGGSGLGVGDFCL